MTIEVLNADTVDLNKLAVGTPPIIDVAHTCHASTTLLYVVIAANTSSDSTIVPTTISAVWDQGGTNQALTQHLNNFIASTNRAVTWTGWLRAPTTGARTLRITFNKEGKGCSATFYDIAGAIGSGNPYGQVVQFRDSAIRAGATPSTESITPDTAGTSLVLACLSVGGNGTMTYSVPGFTTVATGELGNIPSNSSGKCQQTHRYRLNASGTIAVSQTTLASQDRRHGILLVEILPGVTSFGSSLSESVGIADAASAQLTAGRGLAESVGIEVTASGVVQGTGSTQRPAATWAGAAAVYDPPTAREIKSGRGLVAVDVTPATLASGRPAGAFTDAATSILYEAAPANLALSSYTVEGWLEVTSRGRIVRLAAPGSGTSKISIQVQDSSGGNTACWVLTRTTASGAQVSTSASDASMLGVPQHFAAVFPAGADAVLYVNGAAVTLTHNAAAPTGPLVIASGDQLSLGRSNTTGHVSMVGKIARINVWPLAFSATRAAVTYLHQSDAQAYVGLSAANLIADTNRSPVAVPIIETATAGQPKTINPRTPAYDPDGDTLSLSGTPTAPAGHGIAVSAGNIIYTPPPSFSGVANINYALRDPAGKVSSSVARITVSLPSTPVAGFDPALPLGGLGVGMPCLWGQPGNQRQQSNTYQGMLFRMERTGNITEIQWNNRFNHGTSTDYSGGDGGSIYWDLRRVIGTPAATGDAVLPLTLDSEVAGRTDAVTGPVNTSAFAAAWAAQGGSGSVPTYFHQFPTLKLQSPVAVTAGEWVLFRHMQTAGSSTRSISVNNCYSTRRSLTDYSPYLYGEARMYRVGSTSTVRWEHYPILLYGFADGFVAGWGSYGYATGEAGVEERIFVGQGALVRQVIPMPSWANGKAVKTVHVGMARLDNTATADIVLRVRAAGGSPGGAGDNGTALASRTLAASSVEYVPNLKTTVSGATLADSRPVNWLRFNFTTSPADVRITGGSAYYFELATTSATGTRYQGHQMMRSCDLAPRGLKLASYLLPGMRGQRNPGSGWSDLTSSGVLHDAPMFVEFG